MHLPDQLDHPGREYSPIPFWFLNDTLEDGEIRRQLTDFCAHGVYGVVLHPRIGMDPEVGYLSPAFFSGLRTAVRTAEELGMRVVLYDEGMYPSGSACGQVVQGHPELVSRGLALSPVPEGRVIARVPEGYLTERFSGGTIRGIHEGEDDGEPHAPPSADLLNPKAVARFIALTHEAYFREFGGYFGKTIIGMFTDEPSILGRNVRNMFSWTEGFENLFTAAGGSLPGLAALFRGETNSDTALYERLILRRLCDTYYAPLSRWCESHGIALMGHPQRSDDIEPERFFQIPGQDLVLRWISPERGGVSGPDSTMAKCSADMARLLKRPRNANECFGACCRGGNPWHLTGADMKWYIDYLAVRGVNLFIPHAFYYSLRGQRRMERPPDVGPGNIWWPHYRLWSAYMARLSCLMTQAELRADIAVLCRNRDLRDRDVRALFETQRSFQYLPESFWDAYPDGGPAGPNGPFRALIDPYGRFPRSRRDIFSVPPDVLCDPPQPALRTARLRHGEETLWLLVNEGPERLETFLTLPVRRPLGQYDLWAGQRSRARCEDSASGQRLRLCLDPCESLLLFTCSPGEHRALPEPPGEAQCIRVGAFRETGRDPARCRVTYSAYAESDGRDLLVSVEAEEMAELYAGGQLAAVGFWPPQRLRVPASMLHGGVNELRLVVTGSLANVYGSPVPYGLKG